MGHAWVLDRGRVGLAAVIIGLVTTNLVCAFVDRVPLHDDSLDVFAAAWTFREGLEGHGAPPVDTFFQPRRRPPLVMWLAAFPLFCYERFPDPDVVLIVEQFFLALLLLSVYAATERIAAGEPSWVPLLAAFVTGIAPGIFGMSKTPMTDLPLAAMVWASLALLLASKGLTRPGTSLLFGAACGLGLLVKQPFAVFVAGPVLVVLVANLWTGDRRWRALRGSFLAAIGAAAVAGPWYGAFFGTTVRAYADAGQLPRSLSELSVSSRILEWVARDGLGLGLAGLTLLALFRWVAVRRVRVRYWGTVVGVAVSLIPPWIFFSSIHLPVARHVLPVVPAAAVVLAVGAFGAQRSEGGRSRWPSYLAALLLLGGVLQFGFLSFSRLPWNESPTWWESFLGLPGDSHYPGGTNVGVFGLNRTGLDARAFKGLFDRESVPAPEILVLGSGIAPRLAAELRADFPLPEKPRRVTVIGDEDLARDPGRGMAALLAADFVLFVLPCYPGLFIARVYDPHVCGLWA